MKLFRPDPRARGIAAQDNERTRSPAEMVLATSLWLAGIGNIALWMRLPQLPELDNLHGLWFGLVFAIGIAAANGACLSLFAWRWTLKPAITLMLFAAGIAAHFMLAYGVVIDSTMMLNALQSDVREAHDLFSWRLLAMVLVVAVLPTIWVWRMPQRVSSLPRQLVANVLCCVLALGVVTVIIMSMYQQASSLMRNHTKLRYMINPLNSVWAVGELAAGRVRHPNMAPVPIGLDARLQAPPAGAGKPPLVLLVLGETARSDHFSLNGYARPTNPELARENVVSFRNAWSCGTNTAASVPCMFSHLGREHFDGRNANDENLLDVMQRAGLAVLWIDNQSGCKGVCARVQHVSTTADTDPTLCAAGPCFDEIMLRELDRQMGELPAGRGANGIVVVLHQIGSHGPAYYRRTPPAFKRFMPECESNALQDCGNAAVINAFDNTLLYTDHFLASAIHWLSRHEESHATALMYVSDHGESLGENNLFLHGLPYHLAPDAQKHVPWITWLSPAYERRLRVGTACLRKQRDAKLSHDHYFHSVLGLLGVDTTLYDPKLDLFNSCKGRSG